MVVVVAVAVLAVIMIGVAAVEVIVVVEQRHYRFGGRGQQDLHQHIHHRGENSSLNLLIEAVNLFQLFL